MRSTERTKHPHRLMPAEVHTGVLLVCIPVRIFTATHSATCRMASRHDFTIAPV